MQTRKNPPIVPVRPRITGTLSPRWTPKRETGQAENNSLPYPRGWQYAG